MEEVLVVEEGAVLWIEALLIRQVSDAGDARSVQDSLKDGCTVGSRWIGGHKSPSGRATEDQEL